MGVTGVMALLINDLADHTTFVTSVIGVMEIAGRFLLLPARTGAPCCQPLEWKARQTLQTQHRTLQDLFRW